MRLVYVDKKRPEFYYIPIPPGHPYHGRQYMQYEPQWLRGTPLGDILAEADWKMKCLHVGVRSDDLKQKFEAWSNKSDLTGLATRMDFPPDERPMGRSIIMSCESARVHETETELLFVDDPKMKIVDQSNKLYSEYITHYFDSVAYHDEPLFLRMKEIIKLIVANCTKSQRPSASIPVTIKPTPDQLKKMLASMKEEHAKALQSHDAGTLSHGNSLMSYPANTTMEVTDTSAIATVKRSIKDITETWTLQISDDHNLVFQHLNPQMPLGISSLSPRGLLIPDVTSWKELFAETVPWPHVWQGMGAVCTFTGGVTTRDIPVHHAPSSGHALHQQGGSTDQLISLQTCTSTEADCISTSFCDKNCSMQRTGCKPGNLCSGAMRAPSPTSSTTSVNTCAVCLDEMKQNKKQETCSHVFHRECIEKWLRRHNDCPVCRRTLIASAPLPETTSPGK
eukprot:Em0003g106a